MSAFFADPSTWVYIGFVIFAAVFIWKAVPGMLKGLDERADGIRAQVDEARQLREEAEKMLNDYQRKHSQALADMASAEEIAAADAKSAREKARKSLKEMLARREKAALEKIAQAEASAVQEVRTEAVNYALAATEAILAKKVTAKVDTGLVDDAIGNIGTQLNS